MISIIICSVNENHLNEILKNIEATIGVPHELLVIHNKIEQLSLAAAYNKGAHRSKFEYLCFMHEDILFHTRNWGSELIQIIKDPTNGIVGSSGSIIKPKSGSNWASVPAKYIRSNILQNYNNKKIKHVLRGLNCDHTSEVVILDGCFLSMRKETWLKNRFDADTFDGFHFYDEDISLQVHFSGLKNVISHNLMIEHLSPGNKNIDWLKQSKKFYRKWKNKLPVSLINLDSKENIELEYNVSWRYCFNHYKLSYRFSAIKYLFKCLWLKPFSRQTLSAVKYFFIKY